MQKNIEIKKNERNVVLRDIAISSDVKTLPMSRNSLSPLSVDLEEKSSVKESATQGSYRDESRLLLNQEALEKNFQLGYAKGWEEGQSFERNAIEARRLAAEKAAAEASRKQSDQFNSTLNTLSLQIEQRLTASEDDMIALCYEVVSKIAGNLAATPEGVKHILHQSIARMKPGQKMALHMHPSDLALFGDINDATGWLRQHHPMENIQLVADRSIPFGGVILRSELGALDARLDVQLQLFKDTLLGLRTNRKMQPLSEESNSGNAAVSKPDADTEDHDLQSVPLTQKKVAPISVFAAFPAK